MKLWVASCLMLLMLLVKKYLSLLSRLNFLMTKQHLFVLKQLAWLTVLQRMKRLISQSKSNSARLVVTL